MANQCNDKYQLKLIGSLASKNKFPPSNLLITTTPCKRMYKVQDMQASCPGKKF